MSKFLPIWEYLKKNNIEENQRQNIYRWIREGKIPKEFFSIEEKVVKRLMIRDDFKCPQPRKRNY
jgi:hypothetical protein